MGTEYSLIKHLCLNLFQCTVTSSDIETFSQLQRAGFAQSVSSN